MGRARGFEPPHIGTTIRGLNRLATPATLFLLIIFEFILIRLLRRRNVPPRNGNFIFKNWSGRRGSNSQHPAWKAGTLPIELLPHCVNGVFSFYKLIPAPVTNSFSLYIRRYFLQIVPYFPEASPPLLSYAFLNCVTLGENRDDWIRTSDPFVPNEVRYQAALHPDLVFI